MRRSKWAFSCVLFATTIFMSLPAAADECDDLRDAEPRIVACTRDINSGKWAGHNQAVNYNNRGLAYNRKSDYDRAIADFSQAVGLDPKFAVAYSNRGLAYNNKGDYDRAIADDAKLAIAYINRGFTYNNKRDFDRGIADLNQAIGLDPKSANAYNNRGFGYKGKGDYDRAIADLSQAISLDPKLAMSYKNRSLAYKAKGDTDRAITDCNDQPRSNAALLKPTTVAVRLSALSCHFSYCTARRNQRRLIGSGHDEGRAAVPLSAPVATMRATPSRF